MNKNIKEGIAVLLVTPSFSVQKNELCITNLYFWGIVFVKNTYDQNIITFKSL